LSVYSALNESTSEWWIKIDSPWSTDHKRSLGTSRGCYLSEHMEEEAPFRLEVLV